MLALVAGRRPSLARSALLVVGALLVAPGGAQAITPQAGARFDGVTPNADHVFLQADRTATSLADYVLGGPMSCTDGKKRRLALFAEGEGRAAFRPDGSFSYTSPVEKLSIREKGRTVAGTMRASFSGRFPDADTAKVSFTSNFRSSRFNCTGTTGLTLSRDGTRGAPFRNAKLATGRYRAKGRRIRITSLRLLAPAAQVRSFKFTSRVSCRDGSYYSSPYSFTPFGLTRGRDTAQVLTGSDSFSLGRGYRTRERYRVSIGFRRSKGRYRVSGRVRLRATVTQRGKRVTTCSANRRYAGVFASGPKNLF
jgi:hypothetical protein